MYHSVLVDTFQRVWCNHSFYLLCQPEGHQFWDAQVDAAPKGDAEVDTQHLSVRCVHEEVLQMAISDSD